MRQLCVSLLLLVVSCGDGTDGMGLMGLERSLGYGWAMAQASALVADCRTYVPPKSRAYLEGSPQANLNPKIDQQPCPCK